jgi:cytochrome c-type biogenesis protein CcmF
MLTQLGHWLLLLSIGACFINIGSTIAAYKNPSRQEAWLEVAHNSVFVIWAFILAACLLLISAFLTDNFSVAYVMQNSSRAQPLQFKISALWGGQGGSLLLWTFVLATYALIMSRGGRKSGQILTPAAVSVVSMTTLFFAGLVAFAANPFTLVTGQVPQEGFGMNPLLQNYWMQIHPPTLYIGYVGCTVPFAYAISALLHRKFDQEWVSVIRKWVLFTWVVLTIGIILGGVWAYETLGWGGYWAWDPVENASLMPWLSATAFLHSIMLQARRGLLKNWNVALVTLTFLLSIFGTFLTRSGVVQSVHSFAESGIGGYFLGFLGFTFVLSFVLIMLRREELYSEATVESSLSREGAFMLNNWLLLGATVAVLWGTVYPTLSEAILGQRVVVGQEYFNRVMTPIGLALLALTGVAPLLSWRRATWPSVWKAIKIPALWALAASPLLWLLSPMVTYRTGAATSFAISLFVFLAISKEFYLGIKTLMKKRGDSAFDAAANLVTFNPARYGGYIVHVGIALMFFGITGSSLFGIELEPVTLKKGETMTIGEYTLKYEGLARPPKFPDNLRDQVAAPIHVFDKNGPVTDPARPLVPVIDFFKSVNDVPGEPPSDDSQQARRPAIRMTAANDLYLVLDGFDTKDNSATIKAYLNPLVMWIWVSVGFFIIGTMIAMIPVRKGRLSEHSQSGGHSDEATKREVELVA